MKCFIMIPGEKSVGIHDSVLFAEIDDIAESDKEYREWCREILSKAYQQMEDNSKVWVIFEGECPDCGVMKQKTLQGLKCKNEKCIVNMEEHPDK